MRSVSMSFNFLLIIFFKDDTCIINVGEILNCYAKIYFSQ